MHLVGDLIVPRDVTLTISPGTLILCEDATLDIRGGQLLARGTPQAPVWFTSARPMPHAGDWRYLQIRDSCPHGESRLDCAILEFARLGVLVWNASPRLSRLFVRHCRWEGIYVEGHASPRIERVISCENGYNGIALEQFNNVRISDCLLADNGTHGLHCDLSRVQVHNCVIRGNRQSGLSADNHSQVQAERCEISGNRLHGVGLSSGSPTVLLRDCQIHGNRQGGINCMPLANLTARNNAVTANLPLQFHCHAPTGELELSENWWGDDQRPFLEYEITGEGQPRRCGAHFWPDWGQPMSAPPELVPAAPRLAVAEGLAAMARGCHQPGYLPADPAADPVRYVASDDATRRIVTRIGAGIGLPWSVTHDGQAVWTATLDTDQLLKLDPVTGAVLARFPTPGPQAWGLAFDGSALWLNDFAERRIYEIDPETGRVGSSFVVPERFGGAKGLTWTGEALALLGWRSDKIFLLDRRGKLLRCLPAGLLKGGLAWDGESFWGPYREWILAARPDGLITGAISAASDGTWDLAWHGEQLWASQRTNENWQDAKLFALEIVDREHADLDRFRRSAALLASLR